MKPDVLKPDVLKPDVFKTDVLKLYIVWVYPCYSASCSSKPMKYVNNYQDRESTLPGEPAACCLAPAALPAVLASLSNYQHLSGQREYCTLGTSSLLFSSCCSASCSSQLVKYVNIYQDRESTEPWKPAACCSAPSALPAVLASLSNMSTFIRTERTLYLGNQQLAVQLLLLCQLL